MGFAELRNRTLEVSLASVLVWSWGLGFLSLIFLMCRMGVKNLALAAEVGLLRLWEGTWV